MTQFYSRNDVNYLGDVYSIPFDYIDKKEVKVYIDDELWTEWHFLNKHQLTLDEVPEDISYSNIISVRRETDIEEKVVTYDNNSLLNKENLNKSQDQLLFAVQEIYDNNTQFAIDIRAEVDEKVERVSDAVEKLEFLEDSVEIANEAALEATEQAQIATEKAEETLQTYETAMNDIDNLLADCIDDLNSLDATIKKDADAIINRVGWNMFDTVVKDHILTYEESKGLALQGTWVYKEAIAGERYGYPDFYNKCVEEYENSSNTKQWIKSNVTKSGSVVDNQGVLSGFSTANYATLPTAWNGSLGNTWEMVWKFKLNTLNTVQQIFSVNGSLAYNSLLGVQSTNVLRFRLSTNTSGSTLCDLNGTTVLANNIDYWVKIEFTGSEYNLYISTDGQTFNLESTKASTTVWTSYTLSKIGLGSDNNAAFPFLGSIDLSESYIDIDNSRWWTGTDVFNCKKNPNGHVFYDISEKDKVDEVFTSTGMAWLYGIDTENERVFLPRNKYLATTGAVVGNGMTLGWTDGTNYYSTYESQSAGLQGATSSYGAILPSSKNNTGIPAYDACLGITTDPTKSGIVLNPDENKHLYICVGNTVADTSWVDVVSQVQQGVKDLEDTRKDSVITLENTTIDCINAVEARGAELRSKMALQMFDTITKDHILTYEESKGLALQGTYVYKNAVAGSRYGYADFYNKCLEEFENSEYEKIDFEQPVLSANGTLGGASFAVSASIEHDSGANIYYAYRCFASNANTSETTSWLALATTASYTIYNPIALNITNIQITNRMSYPRAVGSGMVLGSNDNDTWEEITSFTNTDNNTSVVWNIDLSNNKKAYKYYKLENLTGIDGEWISIGKINITATYNSVFKANANGHIFYDIADKNQIDELFNQTGMAWVYGIDQENERIFLPRNVWFEQMSMDDVGKAIQAGLPNHKHHEFSDQNNGASSDNKYNQQLQSGMQVTSMWYSGYAAYVLARTNSPANVGLSSNPIDQTIYGNSDTVQPNAVKKLLYICVGNTEATSTVTDVVEVTTTENDTLPLFTAQYFDFTPNNVSWLKAGQQANSGGIYTFTYNELVNVLNGETKYGSLKVINEADMIAGVDYSEYWKVNQDAMTFTTPTAISNKAYSDIAPVVGNGMTLGLTTGSLNFGLTVNNSGGNEDCFSTNVYGSDIGSTGTNFISNQKWISSGVTTDPEKSGVEAHLIENKSAQLYFKVANAVQNLELLDAGEVLEAVAKIASNAVLKTENKAYIVETYVNGTSWYRVYSDGWCEQGGYMAHSATTQTISLLKNMANTNYTVFLQAFYNAVPSGTHYFCLGAKTTSAFTKYSVAAGGFTGCYWQASGYIA